MIVQTVAEGLTAVGLVDPMAVLQVLQQGISGHDWPRLPRLASPMMLFHHYFIVIASLVVLSYEREANGRIRLAMELPLPYLLIFTPPLFSVCCLITPVGYRLLRMPSELLPSDCSKWSTLKPLVLFLCCAVTFHTSGTPIWLGRCLSAFHADISVGDLHTSPLFCRTANIGTESSNATTS
jgi:hypothetical protein